jgi:signal transduction histidine kinase
MPKHISGLNTLWIIHYLNQYHPSFDTRAMLERIHAKEPFYIENLRDGRIEKVGVKHLIDPNAWFSNRFMMAFYHEITSRITIPRLGYKIGRMAHQAQSVSKAAIFAPLVGPQQLVKRVVSESRKYNQTKDTVLRQNKPGHAIIRLIHYEGIQMVDFGMDWHAGVFHAYAELCGVKNIRIEWEKKDPDYKVVDFDIHYQNPGLLRRMYSAMVFHLPLVKETLAKAESIQHEHRVTILNQERIIDERTKLIRDIQDQLLDQELRLTEVHIAGGMAHEIRNALGAAKIWTLRTKENEAAASGTDELMTIFSTLKATPGISDSDYKHAVRALRTLHEKQKLFRKSLDEIEKAIERSMNLTQRVLSYASQSDQDATQVVDLRNIAEEFAQLYSHEEDDHGIQIVVDFAETITLLCSETQIRSILQNLLLNAMDAIQEAGKPNGRIIIRGRKKGKKIELAVEDNGTGISEEVKKTVFKPFFTTKPASGMGLGLNECQKMVSAMGGTIELESELGNGSVFRLFIPAA